MIIHVTCHVIVTVTLIFPRKTLDVGGVGEFPIPHIGPRQVTGTSNVALWGTKSPEKVPVTWQFVSAPSWDGALLG